MADDIQQAYLSGLKMLARRELSEAQLRQRLARLRFEPADIDRAIGRLREERSLDDRRAAVARALTEVRVRQRGRARVLQQIEAMGIREEIARAAVAEVFSDIDEGALLEQVLEKRLRREATLEDPAAARRVGQYLVAQGFDPAHVSAVLQSRIKNHESPTQ